MHHIAFASADIFATVRTLRERGVRFVPISANYYDDLSAASTSTPTCVERMRQLGILYDRSRGRRLPARVHASPSADRFFFEIVQRVGGYDGYGAPNAPARMAALAQARTRGQ